MKADFRFTNHGSLTILKALSPAALEWADSHLPADRMMWGLDGNVIEPRYAEPILAAVVADGLRVVA